LLDFFYRLKVTFPGLLYNPFNTPQGTKERLAKKTFSSAGRRPGIDLSTFHAFPRIALKRGDRAMVTRR